MKILFLNAEYNGCAYWRMFEPARFLNMNYRDVSVTFFPNDVYHYKPLSEWEQLAKSHDIIVFSRVSNPQAFQTMLVVREISQRPVVVEMDDDWSCVDPNNIAYKDWHPGSIPCQIADAQMKSSDLFQVSTMPLKRAMGYKYGKKSWIAPNLIDVDKMAGILSEASKKRKTRDEIRIGWAGSATHYGDFMSFLPAMEIIANKYPKVKFVFRGMQADYFVCEKDSIEVVDGKQKITRKCPIDVSRVEYAHGSGFWEWPKLLAEMDIDIVIVPLEETKFNKSKSNCRYLEFSSLKIPGVYADVEPYAKTITHGHNGFLAKTTSDWVQHISSLIDDEEMRREISNQAHLNVVQNWSLQNNIGIWKANYEEMANTISETDFVPYFNPEEAA